MAMTFKVAIDRRLPRNVQDILEACHDLRDIARVGRVLGEFGPSVDDMPRKLVALSDKLDRHFARTIKPKAATR